MRKWRTCFLATLILAIATGCSLWPEHPGHVAEPEAQFSDRERVQETADGPVECAPLPDLSDNERLERPDGREDIVIGPDEMDTIATCLDVAADNRAIASELRHSLIEMKGAYNDLLAAGTAKDAQVRVLSEAVNQCRDDRHRQSIYLRLGLIGGGAAAILLGL